MSTRKNFFLMALAALLVAGNAFAGPSNVDALVIKPEFATSGGDAFLVKDSSDNELFVIEEDGTIDFKSTPPSMVTSKTIFLPATIAALGGAADPAVELKNNKFTYAFADASADDEVFYTFKLPEDFDGTNSAGWVSIVYLCDQATPTEGEWEIDLLGVADDDADAALGTQMVILDTAPAQNDWSVTSERGFPASNFSAGDIVTMRIQHDVGDPLCGGQAVNFLGANFTYTTSRNY